MKIAPGGSTIAASRSRSVSIQADHDAWVKAFFHEGKGTKYSGIWISDAAVLPAIPFEAQAGN